ncbi:hypothetical protein [Cohnella sp. GCM10027633]|uniref:DMP19 family protein n=1 Tax=unclassified Cohnella TaxID=2636738 RepID=UPI003632C5BA
MRATINREDLTSDQLSWLCIEPMLLAVRGKSLNEKRDMFLRLTEGQQALYLFYAYHNHAGTLEEFYWFASYYISEVRSWDDIVRGLRYFGDTELAELLTRLERVVQCKLRHDDEWRSATVADLETDARLRGEIETMYANYRSLTPLTIKRMNDWIANHRDEFAEILSADIK